MGMNDSVKSAALMTMQTAGITTRAPMNLVDPAVRDAPADDRAGDAAQDGQCAERPVRRLLREVQLVLVKVRHPGRDRGDDEADRRHANQRVAHRRDPQDRPDVLAQPLRHVAEEVAEAVGEQRRSVVVRQFHVVALCDVRTVCCATTGLGQPPAHVGHDRTLGTARRRTRRASRGRGRAGRWRRRGPGPCPGRRSSGIAGSRRPGPDARSRSSRRSRCSPTDR